ncbi:MAG: hypothetical protein K0U16_07720 [Gammaproteobacteria bacterium]|nr:hypothetical protein [Gammaproteobacteria bacterium]
MAIIDINPRDYKRLFTIFKTYRERHPESILPPVSELVPAIAGALKRPGDIYANLAEVLNEPVTRVQGVFTDLRAVAVDLYDEEYATDLWGRFLKKEDG